MVQTNSGGEFFWDSTQQGLVLSALSYGYIATPALGGYLSENYGGKWVFGIGTFGTTAIGLLSPMLARRHIGLLITVRVIQGLFQGIVFAAMFAMVQKWLPEQERNKIFPFILSGDYNPFI
jgi:ACS family sodium-dependent inorganic phosphate cotransporter